MKTLSLLFGLLLFKIGFCTAQINPNIKWENTLGGGAPDRSFSLQQTKDSGFIVVGDATLNGGDVKGAHSPDGDFWVVKLDKKGRGQWAKCYGGTSGETAHSVKLTKDGGYIISGTAASFDGDVTGHHPVNYGNYDDIWVVKLDSIGNLQWENCYGGSFEDWDEDIEVTTDGGYIVSGYTNSKDGDITNYHAQYPDYDAWVVKLDGYGNILWQRTYGGSQYDFAYLIKQLPDGGYVFAASSSSDDGDVTNHFGYNNTLPDGWIVRINSIGDIIWQQSYGGTNQDILYSLSCDSVGNITASGTSNSLDGEVTGNHGGYDDWIIKIDGSGNFLKEVSLGGSEDEFARSIKPTDDGGYVTAGYSKSSDGDISAHHGTNYTNDYWVIKLDKDLNLTSEISLGGSLDDYAYDIIETKEKKYAITGYTASTDGDVKGLHNAAGVNYFDYWVVCLSKNVFEQTSSRFVNDENQDAEKEFVIYPTITTGTFQINLKTTTTTDQLVNIEVFNSIGQLILSKQAEMIHGTLAAKIELNPLLPGGMYFVKASLSNQQYVGKILVARER